MPLQTRNFVCSDSIPARLRSHHASGNALLGTLGWGHRERLFRGLPAAREQQPEIAGRILLSD